MTAIIQGPKRGDPTRRHAKIEKPRHGRNNPEKRRFTEDTQDVVADDVVFNARAARSRAEVLERELLQFRGAFGRAQLEIMDELFSIYVLLIGIVMGGGDVESVRLVARHAAGITVQAPEAVEGALREAAPEQMAGVRSLVQSLAGKMDGVGGEARRAAQYGGDVQKQEEFEEFAQELEARAHEICGLAGVAASNSGTGAAPSSGGSGTPPPILSTEA